MADFQEWQEDDEEEEEDDFIPGADDEEDGDYDLEEDDDDDDDPDAVPSFLEGNLFMDMTKRTLCYEQEGSFSLICQTSLPSSNNTFDFRTPPTGHALLFAGWMQNPSNWLEFSVEFSRQPVSGDPMEEKLLKAQEEKDACTAASQETASSGNKKTDEGYDDEEQDDGKAASAKNPATTGSLKAPPSYSSNNGEESRKQSPPTSSLKAPRSYSLKKGPDAAEKDDSLVIISATQVKDNANDSTDNNKRTITFRGAYRPPGTADVRSLCIISTVQVEEASAATAAAAAAGACSSSGATAGAVVPAAGSRKRRQSGNDNDDDDSIEARGGVEYQELIDLHDDAGLSTEELRRRYYGSGAARDHPNDNDTKKPAAKALDGEIEERKPSGGPKKDDSDDDDDYGF